MDKREVLSIVPPSHMSPYESEYIFNRIFVSFIKLTRVISTDCSIDPIVYAQYIGTVHPWDAVPEGLLVEGWTGTEWIWLHEVKGNQSNDYIISPPYSAVDFLHKIRISFYGSQNKQKGYFRWSGGNLF
jgi:hypothetical protein